jgi:hypothetical protein
MNHDLADVRTVQVADPDTPIVGALAAQLAPELPPLDHLPHRLGGLCTTGLVVLGRREALKPDWQPADLDGVAARTGSWKEAS